MKHRTYNGTICKRAQIRQFFEDNPTEELSYKDLLTKFDLNPASARNMLHELRAEGSVESLYVIRKPATA